MDVLTPPAWSYFKEYSDGVQGDIWKGATWMASESFMPQLEKDIALERFMQLRHFLSKLGEQIIEYKARSNRHNKRSPHFSFLQGTTEEEASALRLMLKELRRSSLSVPMEQRAGTPMWILGERIHLITPENLVAFAMLIKEYNLEWALAAMEWTPEESAPGG